MPVKTSQRQDGNEAIPKLKNCMHKAAHQPTKEYIVKSQKDKPHQSLALVPQVKRNKFPLDASQKKLVELAAVYYETIVTAIQTRKDRKGRQIGASKKEVREVRGKAFKIALHNKGIKFPRESSQHVTDHYGFKELYDWVKESYRGGPLQPSSYTGGMSRSLSERAYANAQKGKYQKHEKYKMKPRGPSAHNPKKEQSGGSGLWCTSKVSSPQLINYFKTNSTQRARVARIVKAVHQDYSEDQQVPSSHEVEEDGDKSGSDLNIDDDNSSDDDKTSDDGTSSDDDDNSSDDGNSNDSNSSDDESVKGKFEDDTDNSNGKKGKVQNINEVSENDASDNDETSDDSNSSDDESVKGKFEDDTDNSNGKKGKVQNINEVSENDASDNDETSDDSNSSDDESVKGKFEDDTDNSNGKKGKVQNINEVSENDASDNDETSDNDKCDDGISDKNDNTNGHETSDRDDFDDNHSGNDKSNFVGAWLNLYKDILPGVTSFNQVSNYVCFHDFISAIHLHKARHIYTYAK